MKLIGGITILIALIALYIILIFVSIGRDIEKRTAAPSHTYIVDANNDGIQDVKVVSNNGKTTFLYGTKGTKKLRLKEGIMKEFRSRMEGLEKEEGKKYR